MPTFTDSSGNTWTDSGIYEVVARPETNNIVNYEYYDSGGSYNNWGIPSSWTAGRNYQAQVYFNNYRNLEIPFYVVGDSVNSPNLKFNELAKIYDTNIKDLKKEYIKLFNEFVERLNICQSIVETAYGLSNCVKDGGYKTRLDNNIQAQKDLTLQFENDTLNQLYEDSFQDGLTCEEQYNISKENLSSLLPSKEEFIKDCKKAKEDMKIETDCCVLVCCEPEKYKMIGE
jgi:hypothetical protein